ncbi:DUF4440 domain-containing protein [Vibrio maerlii]|uniref:nuclear transport factor 2 family protein n=1 Tax=Vibrio maerlii TaxID=2231648 RepID=UPI000E3C7441|nr:DUF4440 domain-containing protein [Vibrio maerlii]
MDILIELELALHKYEVRQNMEEVARLIHPNFREIGVSGKSYDFDSTIAMMKAEKPSPGYIHAQEFEVFELQPLVYLVLYKTVWVSYSKKVSNYSKRSSIWTLTDDLWQMTYHQGTTCQEFTLLKTHVPARAEVTEAV